ncbi:MAG TPA: hypothetical protein VGO50_11870 [Pyrinomonadaceae bacterium]|jgi:hypothetical protein|nr:hypothetical protein [Pyrinomonadaceae bacterium]
MENKHNRDRDPADAAGPKLSLTDKDQAIEWEGNAVGGLVDASTWTSGPLVMGSGGGGILIKAIKEICRDKQENLLLIDGISAFWEMEQAWCQKVKSQVEKRKEWKNIGLAPSNLQLFVEGESWSFHRSPQMINYEICGFEEDDRLEFWKCDDRGAKEFLVFSHCIKPDPVDHVVQLLTPGFCVGLNLLYEVDFECFRLKVFFGKRDEVVKNVWKRYLKDHKVYKGIEFAPEFTGYNANPKSTSKKTPGAILKEAYSKIGKMFKDLIFLPVTQQAKLVEASLVIILTVGVLGGSFTKGFQSEVIEKKDKLVELIAQLPKEETATPKNKEAAEKTETPVVKELPKAQLFSMKGESNKKRLQMDEVPSPYIDSVKDVDKVENTDQNPILNKKPEEMKMGQAPKTRGGSPGVALKEIMRSMSIPYCKYLREFRRGNQ